MPRPADVPKLDVELVGKDGNAFAILAECRRAMNAANLNQSTIDQFVIEATAHDYDHLLNTCLAWFNIS